VPNYHYRCTNPVCMDEFMTFQSIKTAPLTDCQECKSSDYKLEKVLYACTAFVKNEPKTVGLAAERNSQRMGHNEIHERECKLKEQKELAREVAQAEVAAKLPKGASLMTKPKGFDLPEETKKIIKKLSKADEKQKTRYIESGVI